MKKAWLSTVACLIVAWHITPSGQNETAMRDRGLTEVEGLKVGHFTLTERPTGCTVVLVDGEGAPGGVSQRGAAPWNARDRSAQPA